MSTRYAALYTSEKVTGPGDVRPTALQIMEHEGLINSLPEKAIFIIRVSSGIGIETFRAVHTTGAYCFGTVRSLSKGHKVVVEILASNPKGGKIDLIEMEISSLDSVRKGAADFLKKNSGNCNILIANAGIMDSRRLGNANKWVSYGQSKTSNIHLANAVTRRYASQNLYGIAVHPDSIMTNLPSALSSEELSGLTSIPEAMKSMKSAEQGAAAGVFVAVGKERRIMGGVWVTDCQFQKKSDGTKGFFEDEGYAQWAFDEEAEEQLWKKTLEWKGVESA